MAEYELKERINSLESELDKVKKDSPLIVNPNAVLTFSSSFE